MVLVACPLRPHELRIGTYTLNDGEGEEMYEKKEGEGEKRRWLKTVSAHGWLQ